MKQHPINSAIALPWVWMNGEIVHAGQASISIFDRSFQLGDGVFDTLRVLETCPLDWSNHWTRFSTSARSFGLKLPFNKRECAEAIQQLLVRNESSSAIVRLHLSRGVGPRGYSARGAHAPILVLTLHAAPAVDPGIPNQWCLGESVLTFPKSAVLTQHKTASRIFHVAAKMESDRAGFDDALLLDPKGRVVEAISSNVFWIKNDVVFTPTPALGLLPGTTRTAVMKLCAKMGIQTREVEAPVTRLQKADGVFLSVSTNGIVEVVELAGHQLDVHPLVPELHAQLEIQHRRSAQRFQQTRCAKR